MPQPGPASTQAVVALLAGLASIPFAWRWVARALRSKGHRGWSAHAAAAIMSCFVALAVFVLIGVADVAAMFFAVVVLGVAYLIVAKSPVVARRPLARGSCVQPPRSAHPAPEAALCQADPQAIETARRRSLDAMKRAGKARAQDKHARGERDAAPLAGWSPAGPGAALCQIEFDYVDANGNRSHRRVDVTAVDREYLDGYCHRACDIRTFVIGRVRGKVLVCDTGELLPAKEWAAQARRDPGNGLVTMGGDANPGWDADEDEADDIAEEILFTGFKQDRRRELEAMAEASGMVVRKSVTQNLSYVCAGPNAGPAKLAEATDAGVMIIDVETFLALAGE